MKGARLIGNRKGVAAVDFALMIPVILLFILGVLQLGIVYSANAGLQHAMGEAARSATLFPTPSDTALRQTFADKRFGLDPSNLGQLSVVRGVSSGVNYADLSITYNVPILTPFIEFPPVRLSHSRRVYTPT